MPAAYDKTPVVNENDSHFQGRMGVNSSEFGEQNLYSSPGRGGALHRKSRMATVSGGLSLRLRAFALALRGPPAISQIAVLSAVIDRRYSGRARHHALFVQSCEEGNRLCHLQWVVRHGHCAPHVRD